MRTSTSVDIAAPAELVFALARRVERWPDLLPHYERADIVERCSDGSLVVIFVARRPLVPVLGLGFPVAWRSRVSADPAALRMTFEHRGGATAGMAVTWRLEDGPVGCRVTIDHDFGDPAGPLGRVRAVAIDRCFVRPVARRTLATFRAIAEATLTALESVDGDPPAAVGRDFDPGLRRGAREGSTTAAATKDPL